MDLDKLNNEALFDIWLDSELALKDQKATEARLASSQSSSKIAYSELSQEFQGLFTPEWKIQKAGDQYYGYNFNTFRFFDSEYWVSNRDLSGSNINRESEYVYINEEGRVNFISDYSKHLIAKESNVFWLPEKQVFLDELRDDALYETSNIPATLEDIRSLTDSLVAGKWKQESVATIYAWILENIEYTQNINIENEQIFSWVEAFKTRTWVCTAYTKLMLYMLNYAGIHDVEVIRWHVIDAQDFPQIGHAWLRIGDRYYDPTFDDPVWADATKTVSEYKFYGLPKDIFYANRFEYNNLPEYLETASMDERIKLIFNNLSNLLPKYGEGAKNYIIFKPVLFYQEYGIPQGANITLDYLSDTLQYFDVSEDDYTFIENNQTRRITKFQYYVLTDENILWILDTINYDLTWSYLFRWTLDNGTIEWRLAYDVELR